MYNYFSLQVCFLVAELYSVWVITVYILPRSMTTSHKRVNFHQKKQTSIQCVFLVTNWCDVSQDKVWCVVIRSVVLSVCRCSVWWWSCWTFPLRSRVCQFLMTSWYSRRCSVGRTLLILLPYQTLVFP